MEVTGWVGRPGRRLQRETERTRERESARARERERESERVKRSTKEEGAGEGVCEAQDLGEDFIVLFLVDELSQPRCQLRR
jgi:hypothetical protein